MASSMSASWSGFHWWRPICLGRSGSGLWLWTQFTPAHFSQEQVVWSTRSVWEWYSNQIERTMHSFHSVALLLERAHDCRNWCLHATDLTKFHLQLDEGCIGLMFHTITKELHFGETKANQESFVRQTFLCIAVRMHGQPGTSGLHETWLVWQCVLCSCLRDQILTSVHSWTSELQRP